MQLIRQYITRYWETAFLVIAVLVFLWQVTGFFLPHTTVLPTFKAENTQPFPTVLMANPQDGSLTPLPEEEVQKLLASETGTTKHLSHKAKHASKKSKPKLLPGSIHINTVTAEQLDLLPGVGPKLAKRIIDYRKHHGTFQSLEDLKNVKGIGEKNFTKMQVYLAL